MRIVVLRHDAEDDAGLIGESLESQGATVELHDVLGPDDLPAPETVDGAVVLGSKSSVYDAASVGSWLPAELDWLRRADSARLRVLGVCFGAQAICTALGGAVERAPQAEMGWTSVRTDRPDLVASGPWFQLHGDRCLPPAAAEVIAVNDHAVQAFLLRRNLAVQFHPEIEHRQLQGWFDNGAREWVIASGFDPDRLLADTVSEEPRARLRADRLVAAFLALP